VVRVLAIANSSLADKSNDRDYAFAVSASEIIKELPKLTDQERHAVFDKLCELAQGDQHWEQIINDPRPHSKLEAFVEKARAEGSEPLDLDRL
jgi:hypothetical protein